MNIYLFGVNHQRKLIQANKLYVRYQYYQIFFKPFLEGMVWSKIDKYSRYIEKSVYMDNLRWRPEEIAKNPNLFEQEIVKLENFIETRTQFLDDVWLNGKTYYWINYVDGEDIIHTAYYEEGEMIEPYVPQNEEKKFIGWHDEDLESPVDLEGPIMENVAVWAKWE